MVIQLSEFFSDFLLNEKKINYKINNLFNLNNITKYNSLTEIRNILKNDILNYNNFNTNSQITEKFSNILNSKMINNELYIEKIINKKLGC